MMISSSLGLVGYSILNHDIAILSTPEQRKTIQRDLQSIGLDRVTPLGRSSGGTRIDVNGTL
ncbi:hypothetical protein [Exiguobacterium acetylicum]|uniref:hypothetical protein n=1 Tax=Exiguobacterium acetylicum TaxID=41170 RepID=UPI001F3F8760|nr:hypothetical protein [Exiguobacterium acetylicum]